MLQVQYKFYSRDCMLVPELMPHEFNVGSFVITDQADNDGFDLVSCVVVSCDV